MNQKIIPTISYEERKERFEEMKKNPRIWDALGDFGEDDYDEKKIENEFYIDTLDGKFHVYSFNLVTNYKGTDEPDGYVHFIIIDFINKDGFRVRMSTNRYDYANTYKRDQDGNFIWRQYADDWTGAFSIVEPEISDSNQLEELKAIFNFPE